MLLGPRLTGFGAASGGRESLKTTMDNLSLTPRIIMDAADSNCYSGSGQNLLDLTAGNHDFYLGETSGAAADDPTFVGSAGTFNAETHFTFDGGDLFSLAGALPAWAQTLHKSAAGVWTACIMFEYVVDLADAHNHFWATNYPTTGGYAGVALMIEGGAAHKPVIYVGNATSASDVEYIIVDDALAAGPHMLGVSIDNQGGTGFFYLDGNYLQVGASNTFTVSYAANTATCNNKIGIGAAVGAGSLSLGHVENGTKFYSGFFNDTAFTKQNFDDIWAKQAWLAASS